MKIKLMKKSSFQTKENIKKCFALLLSKYKKTSLISVSELCKLANINRTTFYNYYKNIDNVGDEIKNEYLNLFLTTKNLTMDENNFEQYIDSYYCYLKKNETTLKLLFQSDEAIVTSLDVGNTLQNVIYEFLTSQNLIGSFNPFLKIEIGILCNGYMSLLINYFHGDNDNSLETLFNALKYIYRRIYISKLGK